MLRGIDLSASAMRAMTRQMDQVATNLANQATPGYVRQVVQIGAFDEMLLRKVPDQGAPGPVLGPLVTRVAGEVMASTEAVPYRISGDALDFALADGQQLAVQEGAGVVYVRTGRFAVSADGFLTADGQPVLSGGAPVHVGSLPIAVSSRGVVTTEDGNRQLDIVAPDGGPVAVPRLDTGVRLASSSDPVRELTDLMAINRALMANQRAIQTQDRTLATLINQVSQR